MRERHAGEQDSHSNLSNCEHEKRNSASSRPFLARLHAFIDRIVRHATDAEDVFQEALLKAWKAYPGEQWQEAVSERLRRWLVVVARRLAINLLRRRKRHPEQALDALGAEPRDRSDEENANLAQGEEEGALLRGWVEELREKEPDNYRLLWRHDVEDVRIERLAQEVGISENAASHRLARLRQRLRTRLLRHRDDADAP